MSVCLNMTANEWELTIVDFFSQFRLVPCYPLPHHKVQYEAQKKEKKIFRDDERG